MDAWMRVALWVLLVAVGLWILVAAVRSGRPVRQIVFSGFQGVCALGVVNLLGAFTGVSVGFSWLATGAGALLGIPGVITLLLLKTVFPAV